MKRRLSLLVVSTLTISLLVLIGCNSSTKKKTKEKEVIKIGAILNLTGNLAIADEPKKMDIEIAIEEINRTGGIDGKNLEIAFFDSKSMANSVVSAYKDFNRNNLKILLTGTSFTALPLLPLTENEGIIHASACADPIFTKKTQYTIRCFPEVTIGANLMKNFLEGKGIKRISIVHTNEPYGEAYAEALKNIFNGQIVLREKYNVGANDFRDIITKINNAKPEYIVLIGFGISYPAFLKQLIENKISIPLLANETFYKGEYDSILFKSPFMSSITFLAPKFIEIVNQQESTNIFVQLHRKKFNIDPQIFGVYVADFLKILQSLPPNTNFAKPSELIKEIRGKKHIDAYTGKIDITENGDINYDLDIYKYINGKLTNYNQK